MPGPDLLHRLVHEPGACAVIAATHITAAADLERAQIAADEVAQLLESLPRETMLAALAFAVAGALDEMRPGLDAASSLGAFTYAVAEILGHVPAALREGEAAEVAARRVA